MQKNILLKVAARALLVGLQRIPVVGGIIEIGRECWQALREEQEKFREEERVAQLEQAAAITPEEARKIAQEVIAEVQREGHTIDPAKAETVQDIISVMPAQIHERTRATLDHARRLGTEAVAALPVTNQFKSADREAFYTNLFPLRRPQFKSGDTIPHYSLEWKLERLIGAGGFGEVWLARHQKMRSKLPMAIKFCQDETSAKLLKKESVMLNTLIEQLPAGTPHIVALLELNLTAMPYWLAFEYVDGGTLESRIRLGAMDWGTSWSLFEPIVEAMAMVHELNIVHRDLKPANILLDKNLQPRIADFGIGKLVVTQVAATKQSQRSQSLTTRGYGSLGYMSPEQEEGETAHATDDVYALGVILWQMLQGTLRQFPKYPNDISDLAVADNVKQVLSRCKFSRRDKRPQTARELLGLLSAPEPEMILVKAGKFIMGSSKLEQQQAIQDGASEHWVEQETQHEVIIQRDFWLGKYAITFDEYDAFCEATKRDKPSDEGWGRGRRPVINVSWNDAMDYCAWLSQQTGKNYRLPTEAEWEYACRAGTTGAFSFAEPITTDKANYDGNYTYNGSPKGQYRQQTVPVDSFQPNPWGFYQMHGNVWEWTGSEYKNSYDGSENKLVSKDDANNSRVLRGGSWYDLPRNLRSANRDRSSVVFRYYFDGVRLVRVF